MSQSPLSWDVPIKTDHNFFFTQEAFNKYNKPQTFEEKMLARYAIFPLKECDIGSNPTSKRTQKKQEKLKSNKEKTSLPKVQTLSDCSDEEVLFDPVSEDFEEFGIATSKIASTSGKGKKKSKDGKLGQSFAKYEKLGQTKDVKLGQSVYSSTVKDISECFMSSENEIGNLEEFGISAKISPKEKEVKKKDHNREKTSPKENVVNDKDLPKSNRKEHELKIKDNDNIRDEFSTKTLEGQNKSDSNMADESNPPNVENMKENIMSAESNIIDKNWENEESEFDGLCIDSEKDIILEDTSVCGKLKRSVESDTSIGKTLENLDETQKSINDVEEFGVSSVPVRNEELGVDSGPVTEETEDIGEQDDDGTESRSSLKEEFPWDTKYRERRSEKSDLYKYRGMKSSLTSQEQQRYLFLHTKYGHGTIKKPSEKQKNEMKDFAALHGRVVEEQKEFQQYLERLAQTMRADYSYVAPEADRYFKERFAVKKKKIHLYPKYYNVIDKLNLCTTGPPCQLLFVMSLLEMGTVPRFVIPSMDIGERPTVPINYDPIAKHCPSIHSKAANIYKHEPCSQDKNCDVLSQRYKVHITISASALACLVNNHGPNYNREWEIPFTVRDYQLQEGDKKFMHRVVYIDNALAAKEMTGRDKNTMFYKYALRSHMGRLNQIGQVFTANQKPDTSQNHQKVSQPAGPAHAQVTVEHKTRSDIAFVSPIKSPANKKDQRKKDRLSKEGIMTDNPQDDPFGESNVSMEDLETFGTDLLTNKSAKHLNDSTNKAADKQLNDFDNNSVEKRLNDPNKSDPENVLNDSNHSVNTKVVNSSDISSKPFDKNDEDENSSKLFDKNDEDENSIQCIPSSKEKEKFAETENVNNGMANEDHVEKTITFVESVKSISDLDTRRLEHSDEKITEQACTDKNISETVTQQNEVECMKQNEGPKKDSNMMDNGRNVTLDHNSQSEKDTTLTFLNDFAMNSASDEESDALVIDVPEEIKNESAVPIETPQSPFMMDTPGSPIPDTPASPTKISHSSRSAFSSPTSPCKRMRLASQDGSDRIMSPDRSSPTSPEHTMFSSPDRPCKIIPLQRDSEEENVIDNSDIVTYHDLVSADTSFVKGCDMDLKEEDGGVSMMEAFPANTDEINTSACLDNVTMPGTDTSETRSNEHVFGNEDSLDKVVSPSTKSVQKNQNNTDKFDSAFLSPRRRPKMIESESESDNEVSLKIDVENKVADNNAHVTEVSRSVKGKRALSRSSCSENEAEETKPASMSLRKRQKSGKGQKGQTLIDHNKSIEEMACVRRNTRSSIGSVKKEIKAEMFDTDEQVPSHSRKTKSLDENILETTPILASRQTRRSTGTIANNTANYQRASKLAILDRVKRGLRSASQDDKSGPLPSEGQSVQPKRKRGRPPKVKSQPVIVTIEETQTSPNIPVSKEIDKHFIERSNELLHQTGGEKTIEKSIEKPQCKKVTEYSNEKLDKLSHEKSGQSLHEKLGRQCHDGPNESVHEKSQGSVHRDSQEQNDNLVNETENVKNVTENRTCLRNEPIASSLLDKDRVSCSSDHVGGQNVGHENTNRSTNKGSADVTSKQNEDPNTDIQAKSHMIIKDHAKKPKTAPSTSHRVQKSVNPLENIMQAQEKLLDNPKHHIDQAQQEYFSQFKFPEKHNVTYHLWSLGAYNVMIRAGYHGVYKDHTQKVSFVHVSPKMEYQIDYGLEQLTTSEISKEWASAYVRPNSKIVRVRVNPLQSHIVSMKEEELKKMQPAALGFNPANGVHMLANVFHRLHQCSPGQYLLHHSPGSSECQIKKATENNKRGTYDLHNTHFGFVGDKKESHHVPWIPIDGNYIQQRFHKKGRIPATFEPKDYKHNTYIKHKKKKKNHGGKKNH